MSRMSKISSFFVFLILFLPTAMAAGKLSGGEEALPLRPFTVTDSVTMTRLVNPDVSLSRFLAPKFQVSPDGRHFVIVTRKGDLITGQNEFSIILYNTRKVLDFVNKGNDTPLPDSRILAHVSSSSNKSAIRQIRWLSDSKTIAFIGDFQKENPGQVYRMNIVSGKIRRLTNHPRPVETFDMNAVSDTVIYTSAIAVNNNQQEKPYFVVGTKSLNEVVYEDCGNRCNSLYQIYSTQVNQEGLPIALGKAQSFPTDIWLSPDGKRAVGLLAIKDIPHTWVKNYKPFATSGALFKRIVDKFDENTMKKRGDLIRQFVLIDTKGGSIEPIFDAPSGLLITGLEVEAIWQKDGKSVILANSFLPLDTLDVEENQRRSKAPAVAEVDIKTKRVKRIVDLVPSSRRKTDELFTGIVMNSDGALRVMRGLYNGVALPDKLFRKYHGEWLEVNNEENTDSKNRLILSVRQDLNTPPEILAHDSKTVRQQVITDFNPEFRSLSFGKVEKFTWSDTDDRTWVGGLVYPPKFSRDKRYPLVIQTHGFNSEEFLIDGPDSTASAFAAQALANKEIMVLQMPVPRRELSKRAELVVQRKGTESAIEILHKMGLIDRQKVGIIGWSRTGLYVQHLITFSDQKFAAATIADSVSLSLFGYVGFYGREAPGMLHNEVMLGAVPWGHDLETWVARNPVMHLDQVYTPLRFEQYSNYVFPWWDIYAILRRQQKPVEFLLFPDGSHLLQKPHERFASQQGNVDWFAFWLKGEEDPDPAKAGQYKRWRELRELHKANLKKTAE